MVVLRPARTLLATCASLFAAVFAAACDQVTSPVVPSANPFAIESSAGDARTAGSPSGNAKLLAAIRASTSKYQNIDTAFADGYVDDGFGCIDAGAFGLDPSAGGMGFHLINWALHDDPATDALRPDLLVYEPASSADGKPKLVALEYEVFRPDWWAAGNTTAPSLLGQQFESFDFDGLEIFGLHLWLWRDNPSGMFSDFNPKIRCR